MKYYSEWRKWRCRIGRIWLKPGATYRCDEICGVYEGY